MSIKAKKSERVRAGYVMVELDHVQRRKLEKLVEVRGAEIAENVTMASTVRALIGDEFRRRKLTLEGN